MFDAPGEPSTRLLHRQETDTDHLISHLAAAAKDRVELAQPEQDQTQPSASKEEGADNIQLDEETEEQIYQGGLQQHTDNRHAADLPNLSHK